MEPVNNNSANLIMEIPHCELYEIKNQEQNLLQKGSLYLYELSDRKLCFLALNDFQYSLSKEISIMAADEHFDQRLYVLPNLGSFFGIRFGSVLDKKIIKMFEEKLIEEANLLFAQGNSITPEKKEEIKENQAIVIEDKIWNKSEENVDAANKENLQNENNTKKASDYVYLVGDVTKKGLITTGKIGGSLIGKFGQFLINKITKNNGENVVSEETKQKVHRANECSKSVFTFTKAQLDGMFEICKKIGSEGKNMLEKTETGKKIISEENYKGAKEIGRASAHAVGSVLEGMVEALYTVGKSTGAAVTEIVAHKYGDDAERVAKDGVEAVGNIGIVFRPNNGV